MAALLALLSAAAYGSGDFAGGLAARRMPATAVGLRSNAIGLVFLCLAAIGISGELTGHDVGVGVAGGAAGGVGILLLYHGLSIGTMSVVAPITAVLAGVVPVVYGLGSGERPSSVALMGVPVALVAVALLARDEGVDDVPARMDARILAVAIGAGLGFGVFFVCLDAAHDGAGLWPVICGRAASTAMFFLIALIARSARPERGVARSGSTPWLLVACGVLDGGANALFLLATQRGQITLVAVLGALYPAGTVLLARFVLHERLGRPQLLGCGLGAVAVVLVTAG